MFSSGTIAFGDTLQVVASLDVDLDGDDDLVSVFWVGTGGRDFILTGLEPNGLGGAAPLWSVPIPTVPINSCYSHAASVGDFDGDGVLDLALVFFQTLVVYEMNQGAAPTMTAMWTIPGTFGSVLGLAAGDLDGDGRDELVVGLNSRHAVVEDTDGQGNWSVVGSVTHGNFSRRLRPCVFDVEGDGTLEVAWQDPQTFEIVVYSAAAGTLRSVASFPAGVQFAQHIVAGDVDGDGDIDLVGFEDRWPGGRYTLHERITGGLFLSAPPAVGGPATHLVDVDGDGDLDGVCCGGGSSCPLTNTVASTFHITIAPGDGTFPEATRHTGLGARNGVAAVIDMDGDGDLDIVAGRAVLTSHLTTGATICSTPPNSTGALGELAFEGSASLSRGDLVARATGLPPGALALMLLSDEADHVPLGASYLCVAAPFLRLQVGVADALGACSMPLPPSLFPAAMPGALTPGSTRMFQLWHRDPVLSYALTSGLRTTFAP
ncbi:MAG: VCBS repeat-containing protein [Planctomycetota bacterium]